MRGAGEVPNDLRCSPLSGDPIAGKLAALRSKLPPESDRRGPAAAVDVGAPFLRGVADAESTLFVHVAAAPVGGSDMIELRLAS